MSRLITLITSQALALWREQTAPRQRRIWKHRIRTWGFSTCAVLLAGWMVLLGTASGSFEAAHDWITQRATQTTLSAGFKVTEIAVTGRGKTPGADILKAVGVKIGDPIVNLDPVSTKSALEQLPWIEKASVLRRLPGKILVDITERTPAALWQNNKQLFLIDRDGHVLTDAIPDTFKRLPLIVGADAPSAVSDIIMMLTAEPEISQRLDAAIRIGGRRWDLKLKSGIDIKLPEENIGYALRRLAAAQRDDQLLDRGVLTIDLRFPEKIIVKTQVAPKDDGDKKQKSI